MRDMLYISIVGLLLCLIASTRGETPDGWAMTDRFYGFRYEIEIDKSSSFVADIVSKADALKCFGWVQQSHRASYVGEVRCAKMRGQAFQTWLNEYNKDITPSILVYKDTKIRLHFTYFKVLEESRTTCFLEPPHQCDKHAKADKSSESGTGVRSEEL